MSPSSPGDPGPNHGIVIGNVPYMEGDTAALVEYAVAPEVAGWDGVFMGDLLVYVDWIDQPQAAFDPLMTMAGVATRTTSRWVRG